MDRFQLRRDTAARWAEVNPILLEGEVGFETDTKRRKIGDGVHRWNVLEYLAAENIVQKTGDSDKVVMSQKAVTEKLSELGSEVGLRYSKSIANGGIGNYSNQYKVRTSGIDVRGYKKLTLSTNKPKNGNSVYYFECLFSSDIASIGQIFADNNNPNGYAIVGFSSGIIEGSYIDIPSNAVSVLLGIYEVPEGGKEGDIVLRSGNFGAYNLGVRLSFAEDVYFEIEKLNDKIEEHIEDLKDFVNVVIPSISNGTPENGGNKKAIRTSSTIKASKGNLIFVQYEGEKSSEDSVIYYGFAGSKSTRTTDLGEDRTEGRSFDSELSYNNSYAINSDLTEYICVCAAERTVSGEFVSLQGKGGKLTIKILNKAIFQGLIERIDSIEGLTNELSADIVKVNETCKELETLSGIRHSDGVSNGGIGNSSNGFKVRTKGIDIRGYKKVSLYTNRPKGVDSTYYFECLFSSDIDSIGNLFANNYNPNGYVLSGLASDIVEGTFVDIPDGAVSAAIAIFEIPNGGKEGDIILRKADFDGFKLGVTLDISETLYNEINKNTSFENDSYTRNAHKLAALGAACRQRKSSNTSKDFQVLMVTDSHNDNVAVRNAVVATNKFHTIDCMIHGGDMMGDYLTPESSASPFMNEMGKCEKPWFNVIGNHEAGTYNVVGYVPSIAKMREVFIKPMIDMGILVEGEYVEDNCYYYHDFQERAIRLIVLNEYDGDLALDNEYWEAIPYDSTAELMTFGKTYNVGSVIRCNYYKEYSFKCVKQATLGSSIYARNGQEPKYKAIPGSRMIGEKQAKWFLDTLASTPSGYGIIVALHNPFSDKSSTVVDKMFCEKVQMSGESQSQNYMQTDFIADAVDAFTNGRLYNEKIVYKSEADYRNTKTSGDVKYVYEVSKDFSTKNDNVKFLFYLGGHVHYDLIWRHNIYEYQYQVTPICATVSQHQSPNSDIRRSSVDGLDYDSITVISANPSRKMSLVKLGVDVTESMEKRDIELIDLNS